MTNSSDFLAIARALLSPLNSKPTPDELNQVVENIVSTRRAISGGRHRTVFYPACGGDALRVLIAYDATTLLACDLDPAALYAILRQLEILHVPYTAVANHDKMRISFDFENQKREILFAFDDARLSQPSDFGFESVDVVYVFLPGDAGDKDLTAGDLGDIATYGAGSLELGYSNFCLLRDFEADGFGILFAAFAAQAKLLFAYENDRDRVIAPRIGAQFDPRLVHYVTPGGFYATNETKTNEYTDAFFGSLGLRPITISLRCSSQIATFPHVQQAMVREDKTGSIFGVSASTRPALQVGGHFILLTRRIQAECELIAAGILPEFHGDFVGDENAPAKIETAIETWAAIYASIEEHLREAGISMRARLALRKDFAIETETQLSNSLRSFVRVGPQYFRYAKSIFFQQDVVHLGKTHPPDVLAALQSRIQLPQELLDARHGLTVPPLEAFRIQLPDIIARALIGATKDPDRSIMLAHQLD